VAADVVPDGAGNAQDVDAPVGLEAFVFNGDDGLAEDGGEVVEVDDHAALQGKRADDAALLVVEVGGGRRAVALQVIDLGQVGGVDQGESGERTGNNSQREQRGQGEFADQLFRSMRWRRLKQRPAVPGKETGFSRLCGGGSQAIKALVGISHHVQGENASAQG
jgi:hypothetical protein